MANWPDRPWAVPGARMPVEEKLTQRQILFWLGQQRQSGVPLYNMVVEFELRGSLDAARLMGAFRELFQRSDALRSIFRESASGPVRSVREDLAPPLEFLDVSNEADA